MMKLPWLWFLGMLLLLVAFMLATAWFNGRFSTFGVRFPASYKVQGFDVSRYQGKIDWEKVARTMEAGRAMDFVFIKATEGSDLPDPEFENNWRKASGLAIPKGAYHFFHPVSNVKKQAEFYFKTIKAWELELPPVIDIETTNNLPQKAVIDSLHKFAGLLQDQLKRTPIIYTGQRFYENVLTGSIEGFPLWIARYGNDEPKVQNGKWLFWQFTDKGKLPGVPEKVDFNVFNGTRKEWETFLAE